MFVGLFHSNAWICGYFDVVRGCLNLSRGCPVVPSSKLAYNHHSLTSWIPSGKLLHNYRKPPFFIGKSTIFMAIFNSYVSLPEGM